MKLLTSNQYGWKPSGSAPNGRFDFLLDGKLSDSRWCVDQCSVISKWVDCPQWNSKRVKVTTREPQWSHLSCCSIPVWAPGDHSHLDQWSRSPRCCQSACRPHKTTRRWLEEAERGQKSVIPPTPTLQQLHAGWLIWLHKIYLYSWTVYKLLFSCLKKSEVVAVGDMCRCSIYIYFLAAIDLMQIMAQQLLLCGNYSYIYMTTEAPDVFAVQLKPCISKTLKVWTGFMNCWKKKSKYF